MKSTIIAILLLKILNLPGVTIAFTARSPLAIRSVNRPVSSSSRVPTHVYGILTRNKKDTATSNDVRRRPVITKAKSISPEMTEMALKDEEDLTETQKLLKQVKDAGVAGGVSYALWELAFWGISLPICCVGYYKVAGHWPDFSNADDMKTVGAEAFAFVNFARLAVPLRIGLALSTTSWVDENIVQKFMKDEPAKSAEDIAKEVNNLPYNNSPLLNEALASYPFTFKSDEQKANCIANFNEIARLYGDENALAMIKVEAKALTFNKDNFASSLVKWGQQFGSLNTAKGMVVRNPGLLAMKPSNSIAESGLTMVTSYVLAATRGPIPAILFAAFWLNRFDHDNITPWLLQSGQ